MNAFELLDRGITEFLSRDGITFPTPIQEKALPQLLETKDDFLLLAPTGSGKTEAAILPLLNRLYEMRKQKELFGFYVLYVTPLRALNRDVFKRIRGLCEHLGLSVQVRHGDTTQYQRRKQAIEPPNLLITTPETLQAILPGKRLRYHLRTVFAVVVDEIHELADSKRGTQLSMGLDRLERLAGRKIQRIGLSATVGNPEDVSSLLSGASQRVRRVWAGYDARQMQLDVVMPEPTADDTAIARRLHYPPYSTARLRYIVDQVTRHSSTIVFTNTRAFAEVLGSKMRGLSPSFEFDVHHGSLSKSVRLAAEDRLKEGESKAIVATSSLELGIDIGQADLVIQYSSPREVRRALQRSGRAGHGIGRKAKGIFIATANLDDITESAVIVRRALSNKVEGAAIPEKSWDVLCHQIAGMLLDEDKLGFDDIHSRVQAAYPFRDVSREELKQLLEFMIDRKLVKREGNLVERWGKTRIFYYEKLSTIPDVHQVTAIDISSRAGIGVLDEDYVSENIEPGSLFVIRGRPYRVVSIEEDEVLCAPAGDADSDAPRWIGEMIPVPFEVATEVAEIWTRVAEMDRKRVKPWLTQQYRMSHTAQEHLVETVENSIESLGKLPSKDSIVVEDFGEGLVLHAPFGTKTNEALGIVVAALLTTRSGVDVAVERDPYRILLSSSGSINPQHVVDIFSEYKPEQVSAVLRLAMRRTQTFASRFVHVARRMDVIRRDTKLREIPVRLLITIYEDTPVFEEAMREVIADKMDEQRTMEVFDRISKGDLELYIVTTDHPSPLARLILEERTRFEVMGEITDEDEVLRMMEERLLSRRFRLLCVNNHWDSVRTVSTLEEDVSCPVCGSRMILATHPSQKDLGKVLAKASKGEKLFQTEKKEYRRAMLTASLISEYGKTALMVLAGRGIGPDTASRILRPGRLARGDLLREI
ncbi:DEAD/DEAH box helicase, partial [Candidatus Thorarchaeota archaeon]